MLIILIFLTALKGSIRLKMLVGNSRIQIWILSQTSRIFCTLLVSVLVIFPLVYSLVQFAAWCPGGLWVINAEERSQYLVHAAAVSLKPKACWLQEVAVWQRVS